MGRLARQRLARRGLAARLTRGRGQALPFPEASFDGVLAVFPAPYIVAPETVAAIHRVLRPGGRLVIVPEAQLTGSGANARAVEWLYRITGQRNTPGENGEKALYDFWTRALTPQGFYVKVHQVKLPSSLVTVVVVERLSE
jgi:ubiquinone/menaquinone biosynthesis C-methylase UbiE